MAHALFILGELTDQDVDWMVSAGTRTQSGAGTELIREGLPASALYILLDGALEVSAAAAQRRRLAHLGKGEVVGEMSFVDARPPSATVRATTDSLVLAIPLKALSDKLEQDTSFAARFYRAIAISLSHRLRQMDLIATDGRPVQTDLDPDELDPNVLDTVHLAGLRFERVLQRLVGASEERQ